MIVTNNVNIVHNIARTNWTNEEANLFLRDVFGGFGDISNIAISEFIDRESNSTSRNARFAHVFFSKKSGVKSALQATQQMYDDVSEAIGQKWGLSSSSLPKTSKEIAEAFTQRGVDLEELKEDVNSFMAEFEEQEQVCYHD